jgi:hypothetical protein
MTIVTIIVVVVSVAISPLCYINIVTCSVLMCCVRV